MVEFSNIINPFEFRRDYKISGNVGHLLYLWGAIDLVFMAFNLEGIKKYGLDFYESSMVWDLIKVSGGLTMKYYKRKDIEEKENTLIHLQNMEERITSSLRADMISELEKIFGKNYGEKTPNQ